MSSDFLRKHPHLDPANTKGGVSPGTRSTVPMLLSPPGSSTSRTIISTTRDRIGRDGIFKSPASRNNGKKGRYVAAMLCDDSLPSDPKGVKGINCGQGQVRGADRNGYFGRWDFWTPGSLGRPAPNVFVFEIDDSNNQIDSFLVKFQTDELDARVTVAIYVVDRDSLPDSHEWKPMIWVKDED